MSFTTNLFEGVVIYFEINLNNLIDSLDNKINKYKYLTTVTLADCPCLCALPIAWASTDFASRPWIGSIGRERERETIKKGKKKQKK